jgi:hypothetical protein
MSLRRCCGQQRLNIVLPVADPANQKNQSPLIRIIAVDLRNTIGKELKMDLDV